MSCMCVSKILNCYCLLRFRYNSLSNKYHVCSGSCGWLLLVMIQFSIILLFLLYSCHCSRSSKFRIFYQYFDYQVRDAVALISFIARLEKEVFLMKYEHYLYLPMTNYLKSSEKSQS